MKDPIKIIQDYVRFPSISTDLKAKEGMVGARDYISNLLKTLGFETEIVNTPLHPLVLGERGGNPDWPHVLLYGHYDVQPADPLELWSTPPFEPVVRNNRLYGRGTADNKGPQIAMFLGLARALEKNPDLPLRITAMVEGEEEIGSPSFPGFLSKYQDRLKQADLVILSDTCSPSAVQVGITTALRGLMALEVTLHGPSTDLHSGLHGGPVMNPIRALAKLCASLHDGNGRVNVPGFYDAVEEPELWEREQLALLPQNEDAYKQALGVPAFVSPKGYNALESIRFAPTLEFNGITGGYQGEGSKTIIPSKASVKITCRLVANQNPKDIEKNLVETLQERCPKGVRLEYQVHAGAAAYCVIPPGRPNTPKDQPAVVAKAFTAMDTAITEVFGKPPLYLREGGSVPIIGQIKTVLGLDSLMLGLFTSESNLHAPDESFDIKLMERGIATYEKLFTALGQR